MDAGTTGNSRGTTPGSPADLAVFRKPVLEATADDVALVMVAGVIHIANC